MLPYDVSCPILDLSITPIWPAGSHRRPDADRDPPSGLLLRLGETSQLLWMGPPRRDRFDGIAVG